MRLLVGLIVLILLFALLVRGVPARWALPLYVLFVIMTIAFTGWERRRIARRRQQLERQLEEERRELDRRRTRRYTDQDTLPPDSGG